MIEKLRELFKEYDKRRKLEFVEALAIDDFIDFVEIQIRQENIKFLIGRPKYVGEDENG